MLCGCRKQPVVNRTDLSDVIDFLAVLESFERDGGTPEGIYRFVCPGFALPIFCLKDRPGTEWAVVLGSATVSFALFSFLLCDFDKKGICKLFTWSV